MTKPILFSTPMVQQLPPKGQKTQTRRVIKPQPKANWLSYMTIIEDGVVKALQNGPDYPDGPSDEVKALYQPGNILWVRETWGIGIQLAGGIVYKADHVGKVSPLAEGENGVPQSLCPAKPPACSCG